MPRSALTGSRIRERRVLAGVKQTELARAAGISASYLNLIEHNRRSVGEEMLARLARALGVEAALLTEGAEAALLDGLRGAVAWSEGALPETGRLAAERPELDRIEDFIGRFPGWAGLLAATYARVALLERTVEALSDRMTHDPALSAALHEVLSAATSVRSTAAILTETEDLEPEWRARFQANLHADSERLAHGAEALVVYLDGSAEEAGGIAAPQDELEAWLEARGHHFPALEGPEADPAAVLAAGGAPASAAARRLARAHLDRYAADARALPLGPLLAALPETGPDPGRIAERFRVELPLVFRRLAALPPGALRGRPGLAICDGSGTLTYRMAAEGFALPRFGAACPLWPLYQALSRPLVPLRIRVEMAGGGQRRFLTYAIAAPVGPVSFDGPQVVEAAMLILPEDGPSEGQAQPVGTSCRICPRGGCPARREPSILSEEF